MWPWISFGHWNLSRNDEWELWAQVGTSEQVTTYLFPHWYVSHVYPGKWNHFKCYGIRAWFWELDLTQWWEELRKWRSGKESQRIRDDIIGLSSRSTKRVDKLELSGESERPDTSSHRSGAINRELPEVSMGSGYLSASAIKSAASLGRMLATGLSSQKDELDVGWRRARAGIYWAPLYLLFLHLIVSLRE